MLLFSLLFCHWSFCFSIYVTKYLWNNDPIDYSLSSVLQMSASRACAVRKGKLYYFTCLTYLWRMVCIMYYSHIQDVVVIEIWTDGNWPGISSLLDLSLIIYLIIMNQIGIKLPNSQLFGDLHIKIRKKCAFRKTTWLMLLLWQPTSFFPQDHIDAVWDLRQFFKHFPSSWHSIFDIFARYQEIGDTRAFGEPELYTFDKNELWIKNTMH